MAYVSCRKCGWSQDDFYDERYNPATYLLRWNKYLFGPERVNMDAPYPFDDPTSEEKGYSSYREEMARAFESFARRIRNMRWFTAKDFDEDPKCSNALGYCDID